MKKIALTLCLIFCSFKTNQVLANAKVIGNGGNVVICKNSRGKIIKAELLDLFEGRSLHNFKYSEDSTPAMAQVLKYTDKLSYAGSPVSAINLSADVRDLVASMHKLPPGVGLEQVFDSEHYITPKGCSIAQVVNYKDWKKIYVDSDVWNILSETQKAALLLHEVLYAYYREGHFEFQGEKNSIRARYAVASMFAGNNVEMTDFLKEIKGKHYQHCSTEGTPKSEFFMYQTKEDDFVVQFRYYFSRVVLTRTWLTSNDGKLFTGYLNSVLEEGVPLQVSFNNSNSGTINLLGAELNSTGFKCRSLIKY